MLLNVESTEPFDEVFYVEGKKLLGLVQGESEFG